MYLTRHTDCVGITRDNGGYEPRRGDGTIKSSSTAHELWITVPKAFDVNKNEKQSSPQKKAAIKRIANSVLDPVYTTFLEASNQRKVIENIGGLKMKVSVFEIQKKEKHKDLPGEIGYFFSLHLLFFLNR